MTRQKKMTNLEFIVLAICSAVILLATTCTAQTGSKIKVSSSAGFAAAFYVDYVKEGNVTTYETSNKGVFKI